MLQDLSVPVGLYPGWEHDEYVDSDSDSDTEPPDRLYSVANSYTLAYTLQQSRRNWLTGFPVFSCPKAGEREAVVPPAHTIQDRGKYTIRLGPHWFDGVGFFQIHYLASATSSSNITHPMESTSSLPTAGSSSKGHISVDSTLISRISELASENAELSTLLQLVATGRASDEQVKALGYLVRSTYLNAPSSSSQSTPGSSSDAASSTAKPWDIVINFPETPHFYRVLPRGLAACSPKGDVNPDTGRGDIVLDMVLPPDAGESVKKVVATMEIEDAPPQIWDMLVSWIGGQENIEENRRKLAEIDGKYEREYPAYELPRDLNPLIALLRNSVDPKPPLQSIRPFNGRMPTDKPPAPLPSASSTHDHGNGSPSSTVDQADSSDFLSHQGQVDTQARGQSNLRGDTPQMRGCQVCGVLSQSLIIEGRFCPTCVQGGRVSVDAMLEPPAPSERDAGHARPMHIDDVLK